MTRLAPIITVLALALSACTGPTVTGFVIDPATGQTIGRTSSTYCNQC